MKVVRGQNRFETPCNKNTLSLNIHVLSFVSVGKSYGAAVDWMDSTPYEAAMWERMMASPDEWVEDTLPLRMVNSAKAAFK